MTRIVNEPPPTSEPVNWSQTINIHYPPQAQPAYDRGYGCPHPQGYYQPYAPQPVYVQQPATSDDEDCLLACLAVKLLTLRL
ncbi:uncharacterized protein J8A68_001676 [[Candida] subhashii]|uniref:Uncharacterized protein n=1 Tax=[Candida] subhashii TaxID=561895 RepID=A0A8J5QNI3_9ASCO|nr:uncharacterized protein J8A68_001676 [[Candida] subhashii]KAG7664794.1 hypothetical protein J8A68_001676 [[Candida] subhashii]